MREFPQHRWTAYSRDEHKLRLVEGRYGALTVAGDVADYDRLRAAMSGHEYVIHAAASKYVDRGEYDPESVVMTNVMGTLNVLRAAEAASVRAVAVISTDKASGHILSAYGLTKALTERLTLRAGVPAVAVRYGNVLRSTGSIVERWMGLPPGSEIEITNPDMTRFWMSVKQAAHFVHDSLFMGIYGSVLVQGLASASIMELAHACVGATNVKIVGERAGERVHETLLDETELPYAYWLPSEANTAAILPRHSSLWSADLSPRSIPVTEPIRSDTSDRWSPAHLARLVREELP